MSLLLDALRKSEDRRRMGQAPGLELPTVSGQAYRRPRQSRRTLWLLPLALGLVLAAAGAWWWLDRQTHPVTVASGPETVPEPAVAPPPRVGPEPAAVVPAEPGRPIDRSAEAPVTRAEPLPGPATETAAAPDPAVPAPVETPEAPGPEAEIAAAPGTDEPEPASDAEAERFRPAAPEYVHRWELPTPVRQNLPELRLTIHVYAANPAERFVLVNGERWVEGDQIAPGVRLHEIRREGAVVEYRDYRFLLD